MIKIVLLAQYHIIAFKEKYKEALFEPENPYDLIQ